MNDALYGTLGPDDDRAVFDTACDAFARLTSHEKMLVLLRFSTLKHDLISDRFFDAVAWVIQEYRKGKT